MKKKKARIRIRPKKLYAGQMSPCEWRRFLFEEAVSWSEGGGRLGAGDAGEALNTGHMCLELSTKIGPCEELPKMDSGTALQSYAESCQGSV